MDSTKPKEYPATQESPQDSEKGVHVHTPGDGTIPENLRERDFATRNGLNLRSFTRRSPCPSPEIELSANN